MTSLSIRNQVLATVVTRLSELGAPNTLDVRRRFAPAFDHINQPDKIGVAVLPAEETPVPQGDPRRVQIMERHLVFVTDFYGAALDDGPSVDEVMDPTLTWAVQKLTTPDRTLGGLVSELHDTKWLWIGKPGVANYLKVQIHWKAKYTTTGNNPAARPRA